MQLFAANDGVECLVQFAGLAVFLLISFGGWIISQLSKAGQKAPRNIARRQQPAASPEQSTREMATFLDQARTGRQQPGVQVLHSSPYDTGDEAQVMVAEVIETSELEGHTLKSTLAADTTRTEEDVHERFDYEVGVLGDSSDAIHENPDKDKLPDVAVTTGEIVDIFRSPERIREAIILNEILKRPVQ